MYRFTRTATAKNAASLLAAAKFAGEVTAYLNKTYGLTMKVGTQLFGPPRIHWYFDMDSLDQMSQLNAKLSQDRDYAGMAEKGHEYWLPGSLEDRVVQLM